MNPIKILIADDHQMLLDGLRLLCSADPAISILGEALDGESLLQALDKEEEVDLVILDINMPKKDGIEVTKAIKTKNPEVKVLILNTYNKPEFVRQLMESGIDGYLLKNSGRAELLKAVHTLHQGLPYYSGEITQTIARSYQRQRVFDNPDVIELSDREKEIIRCIANEMSTAEIADTLCISVHTVNSHRKNILSKLQVKNSTGITRYALQSGIVKGFDW